MPYPFDSLTSGGVPFGGTGNTYSGPQGPARPLMGSGGGVGQTAPVAGMQDWLQARPQYSQGMAPGQFGQDIRSWVGGMPQMGAQGFPGQGYYGGAGPQGLGLGQGNQFNLQGLLANRTPSGMANTLTGLGQGPNFGSKKMGPPMGGIKPF